jgi:hypothetical protein
MSLGIVFQFTFLNFEKAYAATNETVGNSQENSSAVLPAVQDTNANSSLPVVEDNSTVNSPVVSDSQTQSVDLTQTQNVTLPTVQNSDESNNSVNNIESAGVVWSGSILINSGNQYTNNPIVNLTLSGQHGVSADQMEFSNDNIAWSGYEAYATTKTWTLNSSTFGLKTVYVKFMQGVSESGAYSKAIGLVKVYDGNVTGVDQNYIKSLTTLSANWTNFPDMGNGVDKYEYAIGTTIGATDILPWTNNSLSLTVTNSGLILTEGVTYYFSVKIFDDSSVASNIISSDGAIVDTIAPQVLSATTASPNIINLTFSEAIDPASLDMSKIIISGGASSYTINAFIINPSDNTLASIYLQDNLAGNDTPTINFDNNVFSDLAGNENTTQSVLATDGIAPSTPLNFHIISGVGYIDLSWTGNPDSDGVVAYEIWRASCPFVYYYTVLAPTTTFRDYSVTNGVTYYYQVRAKDAAGNLSPLLAQDQSLSGMSYAVYAPTTKVSSIRPAIASATIETTQAPEATTNPTPTTTPEKPGAVQGNSTSSESSPTNWPLIIGIVLAGLVVLFWIYYWYISWKESRNKKINTIKTKPKTRAQKKK